MTTTQRKYEEMMAAYQQTQELPKTVTPLASELTQAVNDEFRDINNDPLYSPEGKKAEREQMRDVYGRKFIEVAKKLREDYDKAVAKAQTSAEILLNEEPAKPDEIKIKSFERELAALKLDIMLTVEPEKAVRAIDEFTSKQADPYFARQLAKEFGGLAANVIGGAGSEAGQVKLKLRDTLGTINSRSLTPEQQKAQEIAGYMQGAAGRNLFLGGSSELGAIERAVGPRYARYANNPHAFEATE
ncbi:hypothetical protein [Peribacillus asahii]|uniref:hypothetical protein n=1 Tax=Peribacillus asahii TaxID=228899 RepID=UPI00207A4799|nr:hypothetical protein [Peribacillus asahii]USK70191.1 hypothetical protein LIS76_22350 [Peribacillus asahii]